jgi:hypothetical protein
MSDYQLFGWRVQSALALPELQPWRGDGRVPDITLQIGPVPPLDPHLPSFSPAVQVTPQGVRVVIPAVAAFWVEAGTRVTLAPIIALDAPDIRVFLLGTVLAILCFQRGLLPLHTSAVDISGRALLLSGVSGAGKSTLAAAFAARGYRLLGDDLCALAFEGIEAPLVYPAFPRVKLWRDSAAQLEIATQGLERSRQELEKYHVPLPEDRFQPTPLVPTQLILLRRGPSAHTRALGGSEALRRYDIIHRSQLGFALGQQAFMFNGMARLIATAPVVELSRGDDLTTLPALVDRCLALMEGAGG